MVSWRGPWSLLEEFSSSGGWWGTSLREVEGYLWPQVFQNCEKDFKLELLGQVVINPPCIKANCITRHPGSGVVEASRDPSMGPEGSGRWSYQTTVHSGIVHQGKRRLCGVLILASYYLKGAYKEVGKGLFTRAFCDRTRRNVFKLEEGTLG